MDHKRKSEVTPNTSNEETTEKKSKLASEDVTQKKIKLRVSMERVFEIELNKLVSKPDTMLGRMLSTSQDIAKQNENGEYEINNFSPLIFENILNYYNNEKIPNMNQKFDEAIDYLQIPVKKQNFDDYFWDDMQERKTIMEDFDNLYENIEELQQNDSDKTWYTFNLIDKDREDECETCNQPEVDNLHSFNFYVEKATHKHLMKYKDSIKTFLKSKGIEEFRRNIDEVELNLDENYDTSPWESYQVEFVALEIFC